MNSNEAVVGSRVVGRQMFWIYLGMRLNLWVTLRVSNFRLPLRMA